ncbi:MAG: TlyA family rRNA (cytidine-2'-O)-methyltransferase, partial [Rhodospirillales bacterium]|nr:TlyA family rRNA (cytidine-2'-O)-methyltransferase [Rhodospirillales bacterium]
LVALIKPQFEVGRGQVGEGGIVRDPALHEEVTNRIRTWLEKEMGWKIIGIVESPVLGAEGNKEFLIAAQKPEEDAS